MQNTSLIEPISNLQQQQVLAATQDYLNQATSIFEHTFKPITVTFDLKGRSAGMYCIKGKQRKIRYNPYIFAKYFSDNLATTVPHEVAHYIADILYSAYKIRPHGQEWKNIMHAFKANPSRCSDYDLSGIPVRVTKHYQYFCSCSAHQLTTRRHNKVNRGKMHYFCRNCGDQLKHKEHKS